MTLENTPNAISLQASEAGALPSGSQDGPMIDLFGQVQPPANPSQRRATKKAKPMSATSSLAGTASSESYALQQSLESKLQRLLPTGGLMMFTKGWRQKDTPLGRRFCQLLASGHPISETDCGLWPTPRCKGEESCFTVLARKGEMQVMQHNLTSAVQATALWLTPTASEDAAGTVNGKMQLMLTHQAKLASGITPDMSRAMMAEYGQLNPAFPCWLMGYSTAHLSSMASAMQSFRSSRRRSSKQQRESE